MRYSSYKARMQKVRKVLDFFHRFRFVFLGIAVVIAASITTLDLTKGNITKVSEFKMNYQYGEKIEFSGSAFMGEVTFEFRKKGTEQWQDETPTKVGGHQHYSGCSDGNNHDDLYSLSAIGRILSFSEDIAGHRTGYLLYLVKKTRWSSYYKDAWSTTER